MYKHASKWLLVLMVILSLLLIAACSQGVSEPVQDTAALDAAGLD